MRLEKTSLRSNSKALDTSSRFRLTDRIPGITLSSIFHQISPSPDCQLHIQRELHSISIDALPSPEVLEPLSYIHAAIKEALRLRPNPPPPNPRMTPSDMPLTIRPYTNIPSARESLPSCVVNTGTNGSSRSRTFLCRTAGYVQMNSRRRKRKLRMLP